MPNNPNKPNRANETNGANKSDKPNKGKYKEAVCATPTADEGVRVPGKYGTTQNGNQAADTGAATRLLLATRRGLGRWRRSR